MTRPAHPISLALVVAQMSLIALLASPLSHFLPSHPRQAAGLLLLLAGIALALYAALSMRATRFSVLPEPRTGGQLIETGPYRWIRHPMYSAVLVCGVGACIAHADKLHLVWFGLLTAVLWLKIRREEQLLQAVYSDYADYRRRVSAVIPRLL